MIAAEVTPAQVGEWRRTRYPYKLVAAEIADWARYQERGTAVPGNEFFAGNLGFVASKSTWTRARTFLAATGVITLNGGGPYTVA